jgi:hypothetical protein
MNKIQLLIVLAVLFSLSAFVNFRTYSRNAASMGAENAIALRKEIIQIHSVLIAVVIGGLFAKPSKGEYLNIPIAIIAIAFSLLWAVYIYQSWSGYPSAIGANGPNGVIDQFSERSTEVSAFMAGLLGYLCKKEHSRKKEARAES